MCVSVHLIVSVNNVNRFPDQSRINPGLTHMCPYLCICGEYHLISVSIRPISVHICLYQYISVHINMYPNTCINICTYVCICLYPEYLSISVNICPNIYVSVLMFVSVCISLYLSICLYLFICSYLCTSLRSSSQGSNSQQQSAAVQQSRQSGHGCLFIYFSNMFISVYIGVYPGICNMNRYEQDMCMYKSAHICGGDINKSS